MSLDPKQDAYNEGKEAALSGNSYDVMCQRIANQIAYDEELRDAWEAGFSDGEEEIRRRGWFEDAATCGPSSRNRASDHAVSSDNCSETVSQPTVGVEDGDSDDASPGADARSEVALPQVLRVPVVESSTATRETPNKDSGSSLNVVLGLGALLLLGTAVAGLLVNGVEEGKPRRRRRIDRTKRLTNGGTDGQHARTDHSVKRDELYEQAVRIVITGRRVSVLQLQQRLGIGFSRACELIELMEANGVVSAATAGVPSHVLVDPGYLDELRQGKHQPPEAAVATDRDSEPRMVVLEDGPDRGWCRCQYCGGLIVPEQHRYVEHIKACAARTAL